MASIYSAITGQFGKVWILGALLPSVTAVTLWEILIRPLLFGKGGALPFNLFESKLDDVLSSLIVAVILSGLLYNLNNTIIRLYEGYYWEDLRLGKHKKEGHQAEMRAARAHFLGMRTFIHAAQKKEHGEKYSSAVKTARPLRRQAGYTINKMYPDREDLVLPTRLGNIIRSAERYPSVLYDMDAIYLWPRLVSVIQPDYASAVDQSKISLDFTLNSSFLSFALAAVILFLGFPLPPYTSQAIFGLLIWLVLLLLFLALAWFFYVMSLENALAWGDMIRGAFDLYRFELLKKLGYTELPADRKEEQAVWHAITQEIIYGPDPLKSPAKYKSSPPPATGLAVPEGWKVETSRSVVVMKDPTVNSVVIRITNLEQKDLVDPVIVDTLGDGQQYVEGSASTGDWAVRVAGRNPYKFHLVGVVMPFETVVLRYQAHAWPAAQVP